MRGELAEVIAPKFAAVRFETGLPKFGRLKMLNASARNCNAARSFRAKSFSSVPSPDSPGQGRVRNCVGSAEGAQTIRSEGRGAEILLDELSIGPAGVEVGIADEIGAIHAVAATRIVLARDDGGRITALDCQNAGGLPAADRVPEEGAACRQSGQRPDVR